MNTRQAFALHCIAFTHSLTGITNSFHNELYSLQKICIPSVCTDPVVPDCTSFPKCAMTSSSVCLLLYNTVSQLMFIIGCAIGQCRVSQGTFCVQVPVQVQAVPEGHYPLWISLVGRRTCILVGMC